MNNDLKTQLDAFADELDKKLERTVEQVKENNKVNEDTKNEVKNMVEKFKTMQEQVDNIETGTNKIKAETLKSESVIEQFNKNYQGDVYKKFLNKDINEGQFEVKNFFLTKAPYSGGITTPNATTGNVVLEDRLAGVRVLPEPPTHMRDFLPVGSTNSDTVEQLIEQSYTDGMAMRPQAEEYVQSSFALNKETHAVKNLGTRIDIAEEMADDIDFLVSYVNRRLIDKYLVIEDAQLSKGDGTGNNLAGVVPFADAFTVGDRSYTLRTDFFIAPQEQIRKRKFTGVNAGLVGISGYYDILLEKDNDNKYIHEQAAMAGAPLVAAGMPLFAVDFLDDDEFVVGAWNTGSQIFDRNAVTIRFYNQHDANANFGIVTYRLSKRLALVNFFSGAYSKGNLDLLASTSGFGTP